MPNDQNGEEVKEQHRTTIEDARKQGIGEPEEGSDPTVPSYADTGDVSDLGVDEPVVPKELQGEHVDEPTICADCGGVIEQEDVVGPHCGISVAAG